MYLFFSTPRVSKLWHCGADLVHPNIRQYISPTVQAKLDDNQELNYLSEIRQCSILFINLVFDLKEQRRDYTERLGKTLQAAFTIVDDELRSFGGQLNKLFMFDKGCTFLAAFGLPGRVLKIMFSGCDKRLKIKRFSRYVHSMQDIFELWKFFKKLSKYTFFRS